MGWPFIFSLALLSRNFKGRVFFAIEASCILIQPSQAHQLWRYQPQDQPHSAMFQEVGKLVMVLLLNPSFVKGLSK